MPLIKRGAVALGKRALKICMHIADVVMSGQNMKVAAKRRAMDPGKDLIRGILTPCVRLRKRIKRVVASREVRQVTCSKMAFVHKQSCEGVKNELDLFASDSWSHRILDTRIGRRLPRSGQYLPVRTSEGNQRKWSGPRSDIPVGPVNKWMHSLFSPRLPERYPRDAFDQHIPVSRLHLNGVELRYRS